MVAFLASAWYGYWWVAGGIAIGFVWLGIHIQSLNHRISRLKRAIAYYEQSIARLAGNWTGKGDTGEDLLPNEHLYARDLDLFGRASLFELLCQARTRSGRQTLAAWLLAPAEPATILERQAAIGELSQKLDFREDLAVIGAGNPTPLRKLQLADWGEAQPTVLATAPLILFRLITVAGAAAAASLVADVLGAGMPGLRIFYLLMGMVCGSILWHYRQPIHAVLHAAENAAGEVALLAEVLARIEREQYTSAPLAALRAQLDIAGLPPSKRIAQLRRIMDLVDSRDHFLVRLLGPLVLYDLHLAFALENWRKLSGPSMRRWIDAVGQLEALSSLANYAYENAGDVFPTITSAAPQFSGKALSHPLMPRGKAIANDIDLGPALIVSGSNMSGKSTIMRTIGVNAVLAQAGAPVRATSLTLSPLTIGASISTHDSLEGNTSRFYAEILRLRDIMQQAAGQRPVLFLIDEVLSGTNSHDRRIGASAILRGLVERNAIGLMTTHDLALTKIAEELAPRVANVHFEDQLIDGRMRFDYRMQPGVVTHSNAIELMRSIGLEV